MKITRQLMIQHVIDQYKKQDIKNFTLVDVQQFGDIFEIWSKFPDTEIAHIISLHTNLDNIEFAVREALVSLSEWFNYAKELPRIKEKTEDWIKDGKPLRFPVNPEIARLLESSE